MRGTAGKPGQQEQKAGQTGERPRDSALAGREVELLPVLEGQDGCSWIPAEDRAGWGQLSPSEGEGRQRRVAPGKASTGILKGEGSGMGGMWAMRGGEVFGIY